MKVEYLVGCYRCPPFVERWKEGELVREWKNGNASIRNDSTGDGWLIVRKGDWRVSKQ